MINLTLLEFQWSTELKISILVVIAILFVICIFLLIREIRRKIIVHNFKKKEETSDPEGKFNVIATIYDGDDKTVIRLKKSNK